MFQMGSGYLKSLFDEYVLDGMRLYDPWPDRRRDFGRLLDTMKNFQTMFVSTEIAFISVGSRSVLPAKQWFRARRVRRLVQHGRRPDRR
jgi:hypothetical protein